MRCGAPQRGKPRSPRGCEFSPVAEGYSVRCFNHSATRDRRLHLAAQDSYSRKAMMGREPMAATTDRATRIPSGVIDVVIFHLPCKGLVFSVWC